MFGQIFQTFKWKTSVDPYAQNDLIFVFILV